MESEGSLPLSQQPATCPYSEPHEFRWRHPILFKIHITLPSTPKSESGVFRKWTDILFKRNPTIYRIRGTGKRSCVCNRLFNYNFFCLVDPPPYCFSVHPKFHFIPYTHWLGNELVAVPLRTHRKREKRNTKRSKHKIPELERPKNVGGKSDRSFRQLQSLSFPIIRVKIK